MRSAGCPPCRPISIIACSFLSSSSYSLSSSSVSGLFKRQCGRDRAHSSSNLVKQREKEKKLPVSSCFGSLQRESEMERKEAREGKKPYAAGDLSGKRSTPSPRSREEGKITSASELFESLNQRNQGRHEAHRELTSAEFLELLRKQGPEGQFRGSRDGNSHGSSGRSQNMHNKDRNQDYQSAAIGQCDITSSVDYGSRDYYHTSKHTSDNPYVCKENDDLYKTTDTRGNWWEGSFYY